MEWEIELKEPRCRAGDRCRGTGKGVEGPEEDTLERLKEREQAREPTQAEAY